MCSVVQKINRVIAVYTAILTAAPGIRTTKDMKLLDKMKGGPDHIGSPRTVKELAAMLQLTVNAKTRYQGLDTPEGRQRFDRVQQLERNLTPVLWANPDQDQMLDRNAARDAADLLYELNLLSRLTVDWGIRATGLRARREIGDLIPKVVQAPDMETA